MDFTLSKYQALLKTLQSKGYDFLTFNEYLTINQSANHNSQPATLALSEVEVRNPERLIILRHDVDLKPQNSLATAKIEHELGIKGSYYFRMVPESFDVDIIKQIVSLGHEVGYHYETMDTVSTSSRSRPVGGRSDLLFKDEKDYFVVSSKTDKTPRNDELIDAAYQFFLHNLEVFRQIADIKTICMHGSPRCRYDNRDIWKKYDYKKLGIVGEPYFDVDFNKVFYLTDTGRRWDGHKVSVRDKMPQQESWNRQGLRFRTSKQIIEAVKQNRLPSEIMITVHPQRWNNSFFPWAKELILQNLKNLIKRMIVR